MVKELADGVTLRLRCGGHYPGLCKWVQLTGVFTKGGGRQGDSRRGHDGSRGQGDAKKGPQPKNAGNF